MAIEDLVKIIADLSGIMRLEIDGEHLQKTCSHTLLAPASDKDITLELMGMLRVPMGIVQNELGPLYKIANGMQLFHSKSDNDDSGKYFIPSLKLYSLDRLAAETTYMQTAAFQQAVSDGELPICSGGIAIGEAAGTGNRLVLQRWGEEKGKIFYADGDPDGQDWHLHAFAKSFTEMLEQFALPPYAGLRKLCGADKISF